jgi:hypothetical protein
MGTVVSQEILGTNDLTGEIEESLNQIIQAFNQEFIFEPRNHRHHQQHHHSPISHITSIQKDEPIRHSHHRSRSLDEYQAEEHQRIAQMKLSMIRRQWQCQLCHTKNESDTLICVECGSNKINVYIPIIDRMDQAPNQQEHNPSAFSSPASTSAPVR